MYAALAAMPKNPKMPAIMAITKKITVQRNIKDDLVNENICYPFTQSNFLPIRWLMKMNSLMKQIFFQNKESWNFGKITQHFDKLDSNTVAPRLQIRTMLSPMVCRFTNKKESKRIHGTIFFIPRSGDIIISKPLFFKINMNIDRFYIVLAFGWISFCLLHSFFAALRVKKMISVWSGRYFAYYRLMYSGCSLVLLAFLLHYQAAKKETALFFVTPAMRAFSILLIIGGLTIMIISAARYFMPVTGFSIFANQRKGEVLLNKGVHGVIRHPLYAGTLLLIWGLFLFFPFTSNLTATLVITAYTFIGIRLEEKKLLLQFGKGYDQYRHHVPMMLPKLTLRRSKRKIEETGNAIVSNNVNAYPKNDILDFP
jgi:methanethiol S-methyltransferase